MNYGVYSDLNGQDQNYVFGDKIEVPQTLFFGKSEGYRQKLLAGTLILGAAI